MSKADQLGASSSFNAAANMRSPRRRLIDDATGEESPAAGASSATAEPPRMMPIGELAHNPFNPRADLGDLQETADSLLERGQIQPVTVITRAAFLAAHPDQDAVLGQAPYVVLDGNRRLGAARLAGLEELRVDVNDDLASSAADILESALVANLHRADLTPMEEARTLDDLVKVHGSQRQVARRIGKSNAWVSQRLALLELEPALQEELAAGELKVEDARRIGKLPAEQQHNAARQAKQARQIPAPRSRRKRPDTPAEPGPEAASAPNASVHGVNTRGAQVPAEVDWSDPVALAEVLRRTLSAQQRQQLGELLLRPE